MPDIRRRARLWPAFPISLAALTAFFLPLSVLPVQAQADGASFSVAAMTSASFLAGVVIGELGAAAVLDRLGARRAVVFGLLAMALPTALLTAIGAPAMWALCSVLRGLGFALVAVAAAAVVANGADRRRRGGTIGWYGVVAGIPAIAALPLGVLLTAQAGWATGLLVAAGAAACGIPFALLLPSDGLPPAPRRGLRAVLVHRGASRQAAALALGAAASGALIAYAPVAVARTDPALAGALLLAASVSATIARLPSGILGDRIGPHRLIAPGLVVSAAGVALCAGNGWLAPAAGAIGIGLGFGILQNSTLHAMTAILPAALVGAVSAGWNLAYDVGLLAGTLLIAGLAALAPPGAVLPMLAVLLAMASASLLAAMRKDASWSSLDGLDACRTGVLSMESPNS
ncbi:MFS transporter [Microbacterium sp. DT81.1]|uniref:MFS transporter n=1 Tax=Microbacterium sp. DT81.1 TaxID=3393413 RepID=UPI003CF1E965